MARRLLTFFFIGLCGLVWPQENERPILRGAGATFPHPLYKEWFRLYERQHQTRITYEAIGSGGGIRRLMEGTVDFGATDAFLSDSELRSAPGEVVHIPTCLGAVCIIYNLPGNPELRVTPELAADLFLGRMRSWDADALGQVNPGLSLPSIDVTVVHRSDSSGTSFIFTDYLSQVSPAWRDQVGAGKEIRWPVGVGVEGNPGVADMVKRIPGAIGYVELTYAQSHKLPVATLRNRSGRFVKPSLKAVSLAADVELPPDARLMITDTGARNGYPISAFTYLIVYRDQAAAGATRQRAQALVGLLDWMAHEGQGHTEPLLYAPLPRRAVRCAERLIASIHYGGDPLRNP